MSSDSKKPQPAISTCSPTPPSATGPIVGDMIISFLELEGVTHIFGIPGGGLMNFLVDLKNNRLKIDFIISRQETGAAYMADGYYRVTGKLGVATVTTGPGATNALTGMMNAQAGSSAVMLISGEVSQMYYGMGFLQEGDNMGLNQDMIYRASVAYSDTLSLGLNAQTLFEQALRIAMSVPRKAVHIGLPVNVTNEQLQSNTVPTTTDAYRAGVSTSSLREARKAFASIKNCKRPLIFLGNGCRLALRDTETFDAFNKWVNTYNFPVITTPDGKGIFPESHDLSFRHFGSTSCAWPALYMLAASPNLPYDGIMIIGSQLGEFSTEKYWSKLVPSVPNAPFIQVDINQQMIGRDYPVTHGIVSDAGAFIQDLASLIPEFPADEKELSDRKHFIVGIKNNNSPFVNLEQYYDTQAPAEPAAIMNYLQQTLPTDSKIFIDAGNCVGWVHNLMIDPPMEIFTALSMGPMGFAVAAVIGAKVGCPDKTCVSISGDGAFMMQGSEISTAKQNKIGAIWVVLNDNNLGMVSQGMNYYLPDATDPGIWKKLYELGNPDLVKFSEGLGAQAYLVKLPTDLLEIMPKVLKGANEDGIPQVIVVEINPTSVPPLYNPTYGWPPPATPTT